MKINKIINSLLIVCILFYLLGFIAFLFLGFDGSKEAEVTDWDRFYFANEAFAKFFFPLLVSFIISYKPLRLMVFFWAMLQGLFFVFAVIKVFMGYSNLLLFKMTTLIALFILIIFLIMSYVRTRRVSDTQTSIGDFG